MHRLVAPGTILLCLAPSGGMMHISQRNCYQILPGAFRARARPSAAACRSGAGAAQRLTKLAGQFQRTVAWAPGPGRSPVGFRPFPPEERAPPGAAQAASPERRFKMGKDHDCKSSQNWKVYNPSVKNQRFLCGALATGKRPILIRFGLHPPFPQGSLGRSAGLLQSPLAQGKVHMVLIPEGNALGLQQRPLLRPAGDQPSGMIYYPVAGIVPV